LGRAPAVFAVAQAEKTLSVWVDVAAKSLQLTRPVEIESADTPVSVPSELSGVPWTRAQPFIRQQIPAIAFRSGTTQNGTSEAFNLDTYEDSYRLLCVYVLYLDRNLGRPLIQAGTYTAKIIDTEQRFGLSPVDLAVQINRFTNTGELNGFESAFQRGGQ